MVYQRVGPELRSLPAELPFWCVRPFVMAGTRGEPPMSGQEGTTNALPQMRDMSHDGRAACIMCRWQQFAEL